MHRLILLFAFWLTIAATGAWADDNEAVTMPEQVAASTPEQTADSIPNQVKMTDGTVVTARRVPRRAPEEDYTYTYKGVMYTYISENNYTKFFNTSVHTPQTYGWYLDDDGWYVNAEGDYITAASIDEESVPSNGEVYILNDLVGYFTSHTHLGCVADKGFTGESKVKRIYFQDADAQVYNANTEFYFFIGHRAFNNAPQLEKIDLMQYITRGYNHWAPMPTNCIQRIWSNMLEGSPNAMIRVATSTLNDYRSSSVWSELKNRIISYEPSGYEINEYGVRYKCMLAEDNKTYLSNDGEQREEVMKQLRLWNADYQNFNAGTLLADANNGATVYYTTIEGADDDYLRSHDGVARIYNDIGSYYNYKTIAIRRNAFHRCNELKAVEFWQTNGRSANSYSDLKICIENNAFRNCPNLKEIRLFYFVEDGDDHWEVLGPEDVIPGPDIFGYNNQDLEMFNETIGVTPPDIIVSPDRYLDFCEDPNWIPYRNLLKPADFVPSTKTDIKKDGITYAYAATSAGTHLTDQVVMQSLSWWNVPIILAELAITAATMGGSSGATEAGNEALATELVETTKTISEATALQSSLQGVSGSKLRSALVQVCSRELEKWTTAGTTRFYISDYVRDLLIEKGFMRAGFFIDYSTFIELSMEEVDWMAYLVRRMLADVLPDMIAHQAVLKELVKSSIIKKMQSSFFQDAFVYGLKNTALNAAKATALNTAFSAGVNGSFQAFCVLGDQVSPDKFGDGMRANIASNMNQVGMVGGNLITTPSKKLIYHTCVKEVDDNVRNAEIKYSPDSDTRTVGIGSRAFQNKTNLESVVFIENDDVNSHTMSSGIIAIPDSAFVGCTALHTFDLRLKTKENGTRALGPENFILCGDSIFAGLDSTKVRIIIPEERKEDFLADKQWVKYKRFFEYKPVEEAICLSDFGVLYSYAYTGGVQLVEKVGGHKVEHLVAVGHDPSKLSNCKGELALFNDIGVWNNYKLDYVKKDAYRAKRDVTSVTFWDVQGFGPFGKTYLDFDITLQDGAFADNNLLRAVNMVYLRTEGKGESEMFNPTSWEFGKNYAQPLRPEQIKLGKDVFADCSNVLFKMQPQQVAWFEADSTWAVYKDHFAPCLLIIGDKAVRNALKDLCFVSTAAFISKSWSDLTDMSRLKEKGFSWLNGKFSKNTQIRQFPEFKQFEWAGLDYVGGSWFVADKNLTAIELPSTIKSIGSWAFSQCDLREIEIPAAVTEIGEEAFSYNSNLKTVRCLGTQPASLDEHVFGHWKTIYDSEGLPRGSEWVPYDDFKIYVPAGAVDDYKRAWSQYKDYIVAYEGQKTFPKEVTTTKVGELASKLGLETIMDGNYLVGLRGAYWKIDSLTVSGPLNGVDVGVLRFLGGADVNNSDPTCGQLRYLNLYNAQLKQDKTYPYQCSGFNNYLDKENETGSYMFYYCDKLETVILPRSATYIQESCFEHATNLKRLVVGDDTRGYDDEITRYVHGLSELVFLTRQSAKSDASGGLMNYDSWETPIEAVYVPNSQIGDYVNEPAITQYTSDILSPFKDDAALRAFAAKGHFFPSEYYKLSNIDGILEGSGVQTFDELSTFTNITSLGSALAGCDMLRRTVLPDTLREIGYDAFRGCYSLDSIYVYCDSVPTMEQGALRDLPPTFRIFVPKKLAKLYRTKWAEYADHIVGGANQYNNNDFIEITTTGYGQVAEKLGLRTERVLYSNGETKYVRGVYGDINSIRRLKISGPISGEDFAVLRFLAGYSEWKDARNCTGKLEYLDLYDAQVVESDAIFAEDRWFATDDKVKDDNVLPPFALRRAYALKTLILPKTLKEIDTRSLMECLALEAVVVGDDIETINWSAFDDDAALTRMYILATKKPDMDADNWFWRNMCNNYNPTFDAFYVRPSIFKDYINDQDYVGSSWQRTNNISTGMFKDDDSFAAFASHAAATEDDLVYVSSVDGWFRNFTNLTDLSLLRYTQIDSLKAADLQPLTKLERIAMPMPLKSLDDNCFNDATNLHWADFMMCEDADFLSELQNGGLRNKGLSENTLCFMPSGYGQTDEVNVVVGDTTSVINCANYRLIDSQDYDVPYAFKADKVENTRTLAKSTAPYTICLPYEMNIPTGAKAYKMSGRSDNELIFTQTFETLEALQPYLIWTADGDASLNAGAAEIPASGGMTYGRQHDAPGFSMRGTLYGISNAEAAELGAYTLQQDGKWHPVMSDTDEHRQARILPYRAYLLQNRIAGTRAIGMTLEDPTGIEQLRTIDNDGTERVYDLNGRQLSAPVKGVNIINGKKVMTK
jgi:hypothetical protein